MHAFLLVGRNKNKVKDKAIELSKKLQAKFLPFELAKIDDVRNLSNLTRLSFSAKTLIYCESIDEAGEEAVNAFLKNLEEPQENIYFALTSINVRKVLPTIVSRCQIMKVKNQEKEFKSEEIKKFLNMDKGTMLSYIDKIKDRKIAIEFAENTVSFMHSSLHEKVIKYDLNIENIKLALKTLSRLKANGNVSLQLSNFVINYL